MNILFKFHDAEGNLFHTERFVGMENIPRLDEYVIHKNHLKEDIENHLFKVTMVVNDISYGALDEVIVSLVSVHE